MFLVLIGVLLGASAGLLIYPHIYDRMLIADLGSGDDMVRLHAIERAVVAAQKTPRTRRRLEEALATQDDRTFAAVTTALHRAGMLKTPDRDGVVLDRFRAIELETVAAADPLLRRQLIGEALATDRDNRHTRRLLAAAGTDDDASVRRTATVLAAKLGDDQVLSALLADEDGGVVAAAAMAAGLGMRRDLARPIQAHLTESKDAELVSSSAMAMACLAPEASCGAVVARLESAGEDTDLRDRLLHVLTVIGDERASAAVRAQLASARKAGKRPPAMVLLSAGRMGLKSAAGDVRATLAALGGDPPPRESQLLAAIEAARRLKLGVRREVYAICQKAWGPQYPFLLVAAARELGRQAEMSQPESGGRLPSREECIRLLQRRVMFAAGGDGPAATRPARPIGTPVPSAAAAVALWGMKAEVADHFLREATAVDAAMAAEYVAWHVSSDRPAEAFELGLRMLPPLSADCRQRVYNDNERAAGAMLLALSARTQAQRARAIARIAERLKGARLGGEDRIVIQGGYRCALLMLDPRREDLVEAVETQLGIGDFSRRQALTALCLAGRRSGLDWLLLNREMPLQRLVLLYLNAGIGEVLAHTAPQLPRIDVCGRDDLRHWQARLLRDFYAIHRGRIRVGPPQ